MQVNQTTGTVISVDKYSSQYGNIYTVRFRENGTKHDSCPSEVQSWHDHVGDMVEGDAIVVSNARVTFQRGKDNDRIFSRITGDVSYLRSDTEAKPAESKSESVAADKPPF